MFWKCEERSIPKKPNRFYQRSEFNWTYFCESTASTVVLWASSGKLIKIFSTKRLQTVQHYWRMRVLFRALNRRSSDMKENIVIPVEMRRRSDKCKQINVRRSERKTRIRLTRFDFFGMRNLPAPSELRTRSWNKMSLLLKVDLICFGDIDKKEMKHVGEREIRWKTN